MPSESTPLETARLQVVAKKCGARGCEVFCPGEDWIMVPGFAVDIIDTTGAGDSFDAGFIAGRLRGLDNRTSALLANACGAAACTVWGAGDALPAADVVARLLGDRVPHGWQTEAQQARSALGL